MVVWCLGGCGLVFWWPNWCFGWVFFVVVGGGCWGACGGGVVVATGLLERQIQTRKIETEEERKEKDERGK